MTNAKLMKSFIAARRDAIAADFRHLNDMQLEGALTTEGPLLILAGAGSGKTTVLINRIANLIRYGRGSDTDFVPDGITEQDVLLLRQYAASPAAADAQRVRELCAVEPVEPWRIIAITFTNKAAGELRSRLEAMLGADAGDIWAQTFHSACVRILRRDAELVGFSHSFTIYDTSDSVSTMKRIIKDLNLDEKTFTANYILGQISRAKDSMQSAEEYCAEAEASYDIRKKFVGMAYREYERRLRDANALDFDDLIFYTVKLLRENEDVRDYYRRRFRYVLIDEYQDTNRSQYMLASLLTGEDGNICVVGDDDQSIYKFRGATIENILLFEQRYKKARVIRLEQNYRSTGHILSAANAVIRNNTGRKGKELWTAQGPGEKLTLSIADDEAAEARFVASTILDGFAAGANWRDFAVLYRMNAQSNQFEYAFKRAGIPYRVIGGTRFFDRAEIKDVLAYLCVVANPADDLRLSRIVNVPARGIGQKTVDTARDIAAAESRPLFDVLKGCRDYAELSRSASKILAFTDMIDSLRGLLGELSPDEIYDAVLESSGYLRALQEKNDPENEARIENVKELKSNILGYMNEVEEPTLAGFLDEIALYTTLDQYDEDSDYAVMMTMHSVKGLEFPTVFVVGAENGIFPGVQAIGDPDEMEEERRLCYVAITRAKKKLYLTCARRRMLFGRTQANLPSRFIDEIPVEDIDKPEEKRPAMWNFGGTDGGSGYEEYARYNREPQTRTYSTPSQRPARAHSPAPAPKSAAMSLTVGDRVVHKAFGNGTVTAVTPMAGGDALLSVDFGGTVKKLMLKTASAFMKKEQT